ncbi:MAG TPA: hypothetical protein VFD11_03475 [Thiopseudomonas sp.]|nr:hypothetical protein [Thiopseudomonas sp.]
MSDKPRDLRYQVSADRTSASRRVRYVETNQGDVDDCLLCQLDGGVAPVSQQVKVAQQESAQGVTEMATDENTEADEELVADELIQAIENQLSAQQPAATQAVLNKLTLVGHSRDEAVYMMSQVLAWQISEMMRADRPFNMQAYEQALRALPQLPEES